MHQLNNTPHEIQVSGMIIAFQKEVAVYFQDVNRKLLKQAQGGIALSEIINRAGEAILPSGFLRSQGESRYCQTRLIP